MAWANWVKRGFLMVLVLLGAIVLTACNPQDFKTQAAQVPQLIVSTTTDPKTFNSALNSSFPNIFGLTYEGLVDQNGLTADVMPALAESWKISEDKTHITFTLREGLKWSDGHPLTADDVVFTYQDVYLNEKIPSPTRDTLRIGVKQALPTVKKLSDRQVEFTLPEPFVPFLATAVANILPAHKLRDSVLTKDSQGNLKFLSTWDTGTDPTQIVTNGPYVLESYTTSQRVVYRRNPHYWRKDAEGNPMPYIERIVAQIIDNSDARVLRFRSGELDLLGLRVEDFSLLKHEENRGEFTIRNGGPASGTTFIAFNLNKATNSKGQPFVDPIKSRWFNTQAFRQAIAYSLNREQIIDSIFRGIGELQNSPISVQSPFYLSPKQGLKVYDHNPQKARELLQAAGFKYNANGQLFDDQGNRVRFRLLLPAGSRNGQAIATQMQQDLKQIGIQLDLDPVDFNVLVEKIGNRSWDMYFLSYSGGVEPNDGANFWMSTGASHDFNQGPQPGQPPIKGWVVSDWEKEIDRLFIAGAKEFDENKRKKIYAEFQEVVQNQVPVIHLVTPIALSAARNFIEGIQFSGLDNRGSLWNVYELKLVKK
ncbi:ABC transporter substrate-binding protein [Kovacikia minuta CCNUW1]|uniref:ABC transporter substrate-binding protein n=1 Tax=Kovacikia minuta TaxID=2931930 RepID=UPI001CC8F534|nr:ABC transporter substrate-binding protein [Kovacikia minuta]UBF24062.1 ABC transporter substrate-binding protein [Kovacikia minuta CCNUW1]